MMAKVKIDYGLQETDEGINIYINFNNPNGNIDLAKSKAKEVFAGIEAFFMAVSKENLEVEWSKEKDD